MEETLKIILTELQNISKGQKELKGHSERLEKGQEDLLSGQKELVNRTQRLEIGQKELIGRTEHLENGQKELIGRTEHLEKGQDVLSTGQNEIKELIKHTTTLMTENFTYIRQDMKTLAFDVNSDVELLFKEMADVKRKVNKLEQK
ncbi:hypothetical protein G6549_22305 [Bacillus sp. MM2020_1]|nr:hypothetical protein [Bacillus sp. MM2020_1]